MSDITSSNLQVIRRNPMLMMRYMLNTMSDQVGGEVDIPDPTNPFVFLMENFAMNGAGLISESETVARNYYSSLAIRYEDLYAHMSDADYVGRFVTPAEGTFTFYYSVNEIRNRAVDDGTGVKKITIPEYTRVTVSDLTFTMQYPVDIKVMRHGGIQVTYDTHLKSPIQELTTNSLDWDMVKMNRGGDNVDYVRIQIPMLQVAVSTTFDNVNMSSTMNKNIGFSDSFHYARVFMTDGGSDWVEMNTTHSDQVFNPKKPTALLKVTEGNLNVRVPPVYYYNGTLLQGRIRVDVYTSKGVLHQDLSGYPIASFNVAYHDNSQTEPLQYAKTSAFIAPLTGFSDTFVMSTDFVSGGRDGKSFEELREQVIMNTLGANDVPISHPQLSTKLDSLGFKIVTNEDNLSSRHFLATRKLPIPTNEKLSTGIGCTTSRIQLRLQEIADHPAIVTNNERVTIKPEALYYDHNGRVTLVGGDEVKRLKNLGNDALTREVNNKNYLWTPFYYVLDTTDNGFDVRPYDLSRPQINYTSLVGNNDTVDFQAKITDSNIVSTEYGYALNIAIECNDTMKDLNEEEIIVQCSYRPSDAQEWCASNAVFVNREDKMLHYRCEIITNFDIKSGDRIRTKNFSIFADEQNTYYTPLDNAFDITIMTKGRDRHNYVPNELDDLIQSHLLPRGVSVSCIVRERFFLTLGTSLDKLWHQHRNTVTQYDYEAYKEDVPYTYAKDEYEIIETNGTFEPKLIHAKGEVLKSETGVPVLAHRKGELKRDDDGNLILKGPREILREFTLFLLDGIIFFVTENEMVRYRNTVVESVIAWTKKLDILKKNLLDQSVISLKPTTTIGNTTAMVMANQKTTISIGQTIAVNYFVTDIIFRDMAYRAELVKSTSRIIAGLLDNATVTISDIVKTLRDYANEGIVSIDVSGLGGVANHTTVSMLDDSTRLSLGKRLVVRSDHTLSLEDSIDVNFARHDRLS